MREIKEILWCKINKKLRITKMQLRQWLFLRCNFVIFDICFILNYIISLISNVSQIMVYSIIKNIIRIYHTKNYILRIVLLYLLKALSNSIYI